MKKNWERKLFYLLTEALMGDPFTALTSGRSGFQWTRKVAQKTVSLALSRDQFAALRQAVSNRRKLRKTLQQMERVSRQIIFTSAPDTRRRKRLSRKVLGTI
jgi:hypothetical protein